jgi:hypothetical protein
VNIDVAANDTDPDGDLNLASTNTTCDTCAIPTDGSLDNNSDGTFTYTPDPGFSGADSFAYEICDTGALCDRAAVNLTINPTNDPPLANDDSATTLEDTPVIIDVADNDGDPDGNLDPASTNTACPSCAEPANGSLINNGDGTFTYTPDPDYHGGDSLVYQICDTLVACDTAAVTITVDSVNDPPLANDDSATTQEDAPVTIDVAANDTDPDGDLAPATANTTCANGSTGCNGAAHGSLSDNADGTITYNPDPAFSGNDSFVYEVCDTGGLCTTASVSITVNPSAPTSFEVRVATSSDDAEENTSGRVSLSSSDLELVYDKDDQTVGMRFNGVAIPPGATILNAYVQFKVDKATTSSTALTIQGEAHDDAPTFVSATDNITSRARTVAAVSWSPAPWTTVGEAGPGQQTPNIAAVIQETVNRPGWSSGNSLVIIITGSGKRTAESYNGDQAGAPLLHVEHSGGLANQSPVVTISAPPDGATFDEGESITFIGSASDDEDGDVTASLVWVSSLDGEIGTGASFSRSDLSGGVHTTTATATDSGGRSGSDQIDVTVSYDSYFVSASRGSDSNPGSYEMPWQTIQHALNTVPAAGGFTIWVEDGDYPDAIALGDQDGFLSPVRVEAVNPYRARLSNRDYIIIELNGDLDNHTSFNITFAGFEIYRPDSGATGYSNVYLYKADDVTIENCIIHDSYVNDLVRILHSANVTMQSNLTYNAGSGEQHYDINGGSRNVVVQDSVLFNAYPETGRPGDIPGAQIITKTSYPDADGRTRDVAFRRNVFMHGQAVSSTGLLAVGGDNRYEGYYEAEDVTIENNLFIANEGITEQMLAVTVSGSQRVRLRANTFRSSAASSFRNFGRAEKQSLNPLCTDLFFYNNLFLDSTDTTGHLIRGTSEDVEYGTISNNLYWWGGAEIPTHIEDYFNFYDDPEAIVSDPLLMSPAELPPLPIWTGSVFEGGHGAVSEVHEALVETYARPGDTSPVVDVADPTQMPVDDILGRAREVAPDIGAYELLTGG